MSLLLLVDGYNVLAPAAPPGQSGLRSPSDASWLQRERMQLIQRLRRHLSDELRSRTCVVFDAANPPADRPAEFVIDGMQIRFAVGYPEADDLIEELIAQHSAPKRLAVISSDHRIQAYGRRRGCTPLDSQPWLDALMDGKVELAPHVTVRSSRDTAGASGAGRGGAAEKPSVQDASEVDQWLREFGLTDKS